MENGCGWLKGKVVRFEDNNIIAVIRTKHGEALLGINFDWENPPPFLRVGDMVEIKTDLVYFIDGRVVTAVKDNILINGFHYCSDGKAIAYDSDGVRLP